MSVGPMGEMSFSRVEDGQCIFTKKEMGRGPQGQSMLDISDAVDRQTDIS